MNTLILIKSAYYSAVIAAGGGVTCTDALSINFSTHFPVLSISVSKPEVVEGPAGYVSLFCRGETIKFNGGNLFMPSDQGFLMDVIRTPDYYHGVTP